MQQYTEFPSILRQARWIAYAYKVVGLYSIIFLTGVTIISMSNVFTAGEFARWSFVQNTWAFIFAASIDVNIVRMFVEGYLHKNGWAYVIGIGLGSVTGAALLLEGLQQSIGLSWHNWYVQLVITLLIGLRVVFVIILMGREGIKLGQLVQSALQNVEENEQFQGELDEPVEALQEEESKHLEDAQPEQDTSPIVNPQVTEGVNISLNSDSSSESLEDDLEPELICKQESDTDKVAIVNSTVSSKPVRLSAKSKQAKVLKVLTANPDASLAVIAKKAGVSRGYVSQIRKQQSA